MSTTDLLKRDISRADSTNQQDVPAFALFNHFLVNILGMCPLDDISDEDLDYDAENILTGYSLFLRNTNGTFQSWVHRYNIKSEAKCLREKIAS